MPNEYYYSLTHSSEPDLRQCLIYDSATKNARLIGVEYMNPKAVYETLGEGEQKL